MIGQSKTRRLLLGTLALSVLALAVQTAFAQESNWEKANAAGMETYLEGCYAAAERHWTAALKEAEKFGKQDPRLATSLNNLALLYRAQGKYAQAEPLYKRSLAIREKALGPEHPDLALNLNYLALLYETQGKYAEAEPLYKRSLAIKEKALGPEHPNLAAMLGNYAIFLRKMDRDAEAEELEARARMILGRRSTFGFIRENGHWLWMLVLVPVFWWFWRTRIKRKKLYAEKKQSPEQIEPPRTT